MQNENGFKKQRFHTSNKVLVKWILSGCFILLLPMACIIANFFYTKELLTKKIDEANRVTLAGLRNSIDIQLQSILDVSQNIIMSTTFSNRVLNARNENDFLSRMRDCQQYLKNYKQLNRNIDIFIYFPNRDFIVTPETANNSFFLYNSIATTTKTSRNVTYDTWKELLKEPVINHYFIDSQYSYSNYGKDSILFSISSPFIYQAKNQFNVFTSVPCTFLNELLKDNEGSTIRLLSKDGEVLTSYGKDLNVSDIPDDGFIPSDTNSGYTLVRINGADYVCSYEKSAVTDWYYAIYTPNSLFLKETIHLRNASILTILVTMLLGISSIIYLQIRNYRPIGKLVNIVPSDLKKADHNEFELIERYYNTLFEENRTMKTKIQSQKNYAKEVFLLSRLKGRRFHLSDSDVSEYLEWEQDNKLFSFASFHLNQNDKEISAMHFDLLEFSVDNVMNEIFGGTYTFEKVTDEIFFVYIFTFENNEDSILSWESDCISKFQQVYEFFRDKFQMNLSITVGNLFENFENASDYYNEILDAFEYRYVVEQYGVIFTQTLETMDFSFAERLQNHRKDLIISLTKKDMNKTTAHMQQLFEELDSTNEPFLILKYYILSITSELLLTFKNTGNYYSYVEDGSSQKTPSGHLETHLQHLAHSTSMNQAYKEFTLVLKLLCAELDDTTATENTITEDYGFIAKIKAYVETHYSDPNMNISSISEAIGLNPKYMSRLFKDATSEGLLVYINLIRITHAKKLLQETTSTIDEIAEKTGFTNSRSFRRNFLKLVGMNPTDFRK
jgi:AraC-like DNA-binding protein